MQKDELHSPVAYRIVPADPAAHRVSVDCSVDVPDPAGQVVSLPAWIPGSYLVRDFARNLLEITARAGGGPVAIEQLDKQTWRCAPCTGPLVVSYTVHAHDDSIRAAYLDRDRALFNGTSVFLRVHEQTGCSCHVTIEPPADPVTGHWQVATTLPAQGVDEAGFGRYCAPDYATLVDHPVVMGALDRVPFDVAGVAHEFVLVGRQDADKRRLAKDLAAVCTVHANFWGELPTQRYVFLALVVDRGYGGIEHRDCAVLQVARDALPLTHREPGATYREFLGLCSHEYFHLWNVKRIRPAAVAASDLSAAAYFADLWAYEGITSYYDELGVVRAGLWSTQQYLDKLAGSISRLQRTPARKRQSLSQSSLTAWSKFYQPDDNRPNAVVSYYNKGALLSLCVDLLLRRDSAGALDLDCVMRALWQRYGRNDRPAPDGALENLICESAGEHWRAFFDRTVRGTQPLPVVAALGSVGIRCTYEREDDGPAWLRALGVTLKADVDAPQLQYVLDDTPAQRAGMSPGDIVVAVDGLRVTADNFGARLQRLPPAREVAVHVFRADQLLELEIAALQPLEDTCRLSLDAHASDAQLARRRRWLGESAPG